MAVRDRGALATARLLACALTWMFTGATAVACAAIFVSEEPLYPASLAAVFAAGAVSHGGLWALLTRV
ncbi:MAG TPA: hypothetical protein VGF17_20120 [Phytomonospora sp.]